MSRQRRELKSPITGTVLAVNVSVGTAPDPSDKKPLVTVEGDVVINCLGNINVFALLANDNRILTPQSAFIPPKP